MNPVMPASNSNLRLSPSVSMESISTLDSGLSNHSNQTSNYSEGASFVSNPNSVLTGDLDHDDESAYSEGDDQSTFSDTTHSDASTIRDALYGNDPANNEPPVINNPFDEEYCRLLKKILEQGNERDDRTNTGTISLFGEQLRFSLADNKFPLLTLKKTSLHSIASELLWFCRGCTDAFDLHLDDVFIWDANGSRAFLDSVGLHDNRVGDLGPIYGFQWRHWGSEYRTCDKFSLTEGFDQLKNVIRQIKEEPTSRRIIMSAWNVGDLPKMALPPCHCFVQFYVNNKKLSCHLYQRSGDMALGVPFNIASYSLLTKMIAYLTNLEPGELIISFGDAHIYKNHVNGVKEMLKRTPKPPPRLIIKPFRKVECMDDFHIDDFVLQNYESHPKISLPMAV